MNGPEEFHSDSLELDPWAFEPADGAPFDPTIVDAVLTGAVDADDPIAVAVKEWSAPTDDDLEWAVEMLRTYQAAVAEVDRRAESKIGRLRSRIEAIETQAGLLKAGPSRMAAYFEGRLKAAAVRLRAETSKPSHPLIGATLKARTNFTGVKIKITDQPTLLMWAKGLPKAEQPAIKVTEEILVTSLRDLHGIKIAEVNDGWTNQGSYECGHGFGLAWSEGPDEPPVVDRRDVGELYTCGVCSEMVLVVEAEFKAVTRTVVVDRHGHLIPGAGIDYPTITPSIEFS